MSKLPVSFEFFPPKTPEGAEKLRVVRQQLYTQAPEFCSVTYGAGGSTQEGTFGTVVKQTLFPKISLVNKPSWLDKNLQSSFI